MSGSFHLGNIIITNIIIADVYQLFFLDPMVILKVL